MWLGFACMKAHETETSTEQPANGLRAARAVCRDRGISDTTLWRWSKNGWIRTVNISGKLYVDMMSLAEFDRRAATGEFSKPAVGAAKIAAEKRAANALAEVPKPSV